MTLDRMYALVGNWRVNEGEKGLSVYSYNPENARLELIETRFRHVSVGMQFLDEERNLVYLVDERGSDRERDGEGGYVLAVSLDPETGKLTLINEKHTLMPKPACLWMDKSGRYLLVVHHLNDYYASKIIKDEDGRFRSWSEYDDGGVVVFRLNGDGSIGDICDVSLIKGQWNGKNHKVPRQHCICADPSGELYVVCDKGLDRLYTYRLDREEGRIIPLSVYQAGEGTAPRHCIFHPKLPLLYCIYEQRAEVVVFRFQRETGILEPLAAVPLMLEMTADEDVYAIDAVIHPNGRYLYVSARNMNTISAFEIDESGMLDLKQNIFTEGINPRGMCIAPDGRFLLVAQVAMGEICSFAILSDGTLVPTGRRVGAIRPSNIRIYSSYFKKEGEDKNGREHLDTGETGKLF